MVNPINSALDELHIISEGFVKRLLTDMFGKSDDWPEAAIIAKRIDKFFDNNFLNTESINFAMQNAIVNGIQMGLKQKDVAAQFNITRSTVSRIFNRYKYNGAVLVGKSPGRPRKTNHLTDRNILRVSRDNPRLSAAEVADLVDGPLTLVPSVRTVRRCLAESGLHGRRPAIKPFINAKNRKGPCQLGTLRVEICAVV
uniref:HTH_Tnp_Tc3_2 domain-containing protein n=1 Tax=Caenorhabditis japonica TaxID=281687 RepID=A0A8R1IQ81_CAEJA